MTDKNAQKKTDFNQLSDRNKDLPSPHRQKPMQETIRHRLSLLSVSSAALLFVTLTPQSALASGGAADQISPFIYLLSIFVMAVFVGYYVVWSVTPALHTPLMAVTNAISSVIVVGALLAVGVSALEGSGSAGLFGFGALVMAAINIFGGFLVTRRMLAMYKKKDR